MTLSYTTTNKPASRELLNAVCLFEAPLTDACNTFNLAGPAPKWVQGYSREFPGLTLCVYGPDDVEAGGQVYVRFQEHTAPNGRVNRRVVIIPTATAKRNPFNPIPLEAQSMCDLMISWSVAGEDADIICLPGEDVQVRTSDGLEVARSWSPEQESDQTEDDGYSRARRHFADEEIAGAPKEDFNVSE